MRNSRLAWFTVMLLATMPLFAQSALQPPQLPKQDIVFVIDNSGSMEMPPTVSDPLRLRGVAAGLILDAVEVSSDVQAGLVLFSDDASTDGKLHKDTTVVRQRLRADRLPDANGGTNMLDALNKAIAMFSGSSADRKRIVLITDGAPNPGQASTILSATVPAARAAGIQIFALGLSSNVDQKFLDEITKATGGRTLVALQHQQLLDLAKQLVGDLDNVYTLPKENLPSATMEYPFTLRSGVDRARLTAVLEQPKEFAPEEIVFALEGPEQGLTHTYEIRPQGADRVAAWTTFFSKPGDYKLRITVRKPGAAGHLGVRLVLEVLSDLRARVTLTPSAAVQVIGDQVRVDVDVVTPSGTQNPAGLKITGSVRTSGGGSTTIPFNGAQGLFEVPAVPGRHTVVVRVETAFSQTEVRAEYDAFQHAPPKLVSSRESLKFVKALGPADPQIEETFKLRAEFPAGARPKPVSFSFTLVSPAGIVELARAGGGALKPGVTEYVIPPGGLELVLRIRMDPASRLPKKGGAFASEIRFVSTQAEGQVMPFAFDFRVPRFEVKGKREAFTLWWDPHRERVVRLGALETDLAANSTFYVILPEAIHAPDQGPKIADLALQMEGGAPDPERIEGGKLRYGPLELEAGKDFALDVRVSPATVTGWEKLPARPRPIEIELVSDLGMETRIEPKFWSVGGRFRDFPLLGTWSRHGRHWSSVLFLLIAIALVASMATRRVRAVRSFWPYRPGSILPVRFGAIQIGEISAQSGAALVLPNTDSLLDNTTLGHIYAEPKAQRVEDASGQLSPSRARLGPGDLLTITHPDPGDGSQDTLWELEYVDFDPVDGGEVVVTKSPAPWTLSRLMRWSAVTVVVVAVLAWVFGSSLASTIAYRVLPFVESLYLRMLQ